MAKATVKTVEITPAVEAVVEDRVILELTREEALFIRSTFGGTTAGLVDKTPMRTIQDALYTVFPDYLSGSKYVVVTRKDRERFSVMDNG